MNTPDACTAPVALTLVTVTPGQGHATKRLIADADGRPMSDPARALWIAGGQAQHVQVPGLAGLRDLLTGIRPNQVLVHGIPHGSAPGDVWTLLTAEHYLGTPGTIARTLDCFAYPRDLCVIMLDYDVDPAAHVTVTSAEALMAHMAAIWPVMRDVGYLRTYSTRSAIRPKGRPGDWLTPPAGMHVYLLVRGDVARFRDLLRIKLWCAGLGFCRFASENTHTGVAAILERALVDLTVLSPERLDYIAGAEIAPDAPFYQDRPAPELHAGLILDLDALPDATDEERRDYARRLEAAKDALRPSQRERVRQTVRAQAPALQGDAQEQEITRRLLHAERGELAPAHPLEFPARQITAQDLATGAGHALDGRRLRDPQEPDYGPSQAVFHWRGGDWRIVSWAHGVRKVYRLAVSDPDRPYHQPLPGLRLTLPGLRTTLRSL